jgi:DnaK suppressor protein
MPRQDTLLRLHKTLKARRAKLCNILADELAELRNYKPADSPGDSADEAFGAGSDEMSSRLAELDARELSQIERALARFKQGTFRICEGGGKHCQKKIPMARLNALPYSNYCINCQREIDQYPDERDRRGKGHWDQVFDSDAPSKDHRVNLSEMEMDLAGNRRG